MDHNIKQTNMSELDFANHICEFTTRMKNLEPVLQALMEAAPSTEGKPNVGRALLIAGEAARKVSEVFSQSIPGLEILTSSRYPNEVDKGIVYQAEQGAMYDRAERQAAEEMAAMGHSLRRRPQTADELLRAEAGIEWQLEETRDQLEATRALLDPEACSPKQLSDAELAQITARNREAEDAASEAEERDRVERRRMLVAAGKLAACRHCGNLVHVNELARHEGEYCIRRPPPPQQRPKGMMVPPLTRPTGTCGLATVESGSPARQLYLQLEREADPRANDNLAVLQAKHTAHVAVRKLREAECAQITARNRAAQDAWEAEKRKRVERRAALVAERNLREAELAQIDAWEAEERERAARRAAERKPWIDEMRKWQEGLAAKMERPRPPKSAMKGKRRRVQLSRTDEDEDYDSDGFESQCALEKTVLSSLRRKKARKAKDKVAHIARKSAPNLGPRPLKVDRGLGSARSWRLRCGTKTIPRAITGTEYPDRKWEKSKSKNKRGRKKQAMEKRAG